MAASYRCSLVIVETKIDVGFFLVFVCGQLRCFSSHEADFFFFFLLLSSGGWGKIKL